MPKPLEKKSNFKIMASVAALGGFLTGSGILISLLLNSRSEKGIEIIPAVEETRKEAVVDVEGAVEKPGVYRLPSDARILDAIAAAGGLALEADRSYIERYYNLAQKVEDGSKIYIPGKSSTPLRQGFVGQASTTSNTGAEQTDNIQGKISINSAGLSELDALWGIGEARAQAIIKGRPYTRIEELLERKILPQNVFDRNKEKLTL